MVAQALQRGESSDGDGRGLLEREVRRFPCNSLLHADVLGERSVSRAKRVVTRLEVGDVLADRFHGPGEIGACRR